MEEIDEEILLVRDLRVVQGEMMRQLEYFSPFEALISYRGYKKEKDKWIVIFPI